MLNKEILPPEADMTKESFLDKAKQGTASSGLQLVKSLVINMPDVGCTKWGAILVVACTMRSFVTIVLDYWDNNIWTKTSDVKLIDLNLKRSMKTRYLGTQILFGPQPPP